MPRCRPCGGSCSAGDARHRPADRQRDHPDAQDDLARQVIASPELLNAAQIIYAGNFETIPLLIVAALWYLCHTC